ncbi:hypothetical protein [Tenacibaculum insulae]|uniref:hypothetical protein n=1 Tax=Tenacibaculum insulae TaxID=2029677 RepID=UPI003AB5157C
MKKITLIIALFITVMNQAQNYSFVPKNLKLISMDELMRKGPPSKLDLVYYEDGTKTTLKEVMPLIMQQKLMPKMFVDKNGNYKLLIAAGEKPQKQAYSFVPKNLKLISMDELVKKGRPSKLDLVYYEDGTKTTLEKAMPLIMQQKVTPKMFVDKNGNYKLLVLVKIKPVKVVINYKNIPKRLANLGYSFGNPESNTVIINTQGGPIADIETKSFEGFFVEIGKINPKDVFAINVHQVQTLHPEWFNKKEITHEQSIEFNKETTKILYDMVSYFKSQNKKVYVTGFSYGAFAGADLLAEYGDVADGYLFMVGRLDMTEKIWKTFSQGTEASFKEDGTEVIIHKKQNNILDNNLKRTASGFGHKRYTNLLKDTNLSNVIYITGKKDQAVGRLTKKEIDFLKLKNATVIIGEGGHETTETHLKKGLSLLFKK